MIIVNPKLEAPAFSQFIGGGGPVIPGPLFPFVFITIACGAISGFHALIATGTTSKMVDQESDIRPVGYGAMLFEGARRRHGADRRLRAASRRLLRHQHHAGSRSRTSHMPIVNLPDLQAQVGENVIGRTGGAVSLAVGMAQIFANLPGMRGLMAYWYHFAIMFEALFILTTIDSGTRVGRFLLQESIGRVWPKFGDTNWLPSALMSSGVMVLLLGLFHLDRQHRHDLADVRRRQPAARVGRAGGRHDDPHQHRTRAVRVGHVRCRSASCRSTTLTAGYMSIRDNFWPMADRGRSGAARAVATSTRSARRS